MKLADLTAYAEDKYHIREQYKWADLPGFSVLVDPGTGKWAALLMRRWDGDLGAEIEVCDIKCGQSCRKEYDAPFLSDPFRMKGEKWVGVTIDERTDPETVFSLFDRAVESGEHRGFRIVLEEIRGVTRGFYKDTSLPPAGVRRRKDKERADRQRESLRRRDAQRNDLRRRDTQRVNMRQLDLQRENLRRRDVQCKADIDHILQQVPYRIREMMDLYEYGDFSPAARDRNFYRQGKYMEDYEDNAPWNGEVRRYFLTYHDLNLVQLRGYFTWRTQVRRGEYSAVSASFAYMYLYELLCGIGTESPEDSLRKMQAFEHGYLDAGAGDKSMRVNLHRWMMEFAVLKDLPQDTVLPFIPQEQIARDHALIKLRDPQEYTDEEVYEALSALSDGKTEKSSALNKQRERAVHLFACIWRHMFLHYQKDGLDIFTACFGKRRMYPWHPLANAVYYSEEVCVDREYRIDAVRRFLCRSGVWYQERYDDLYFDRYRIHAVMHEADRQIRRYLKTGHYLRAKEGEEWITPFVDAVIEEDKAAVCEAAKPRVTIDLSGLEKIRRDASITRDSLLTEEEKQAFSGVSGEAEDLRAAESAAAESTVAESTAAESTAAESIAAESTVVESAAAESAVAESTPPDCIEAETDVDDSINGKASVTENFTQESRILPDAMHEQILRTVLRGEEVSGLIRSRHLMASVVTDTINEALFDEIGDNVLECDGDRISLVEDYREDLMDLMYGGD